MNGASPDADQRERALRVILPCAVLALGILTWDLVVRLNDIPPYVLPGPLLVARTLEADSESFSNAGCRTSQITERFRAWPMALGGVEKRHRCLFRTAPEQAGPVEGHRTIYVGRCDRQPL